MLDRYPSPVAMFDAAGTLVYSNRSQSEGSTDSWVDLAPLGTHLSELGQVTRYGDEALSEMRAGIADVIAGNTDHFELDYAADTATGLRWFRVVVTPTGEFAPRGALVLNHDLTESKRTEERLQVSEERLDLALWGTGLGFWEWDVVTGDLRLGERWAEMLGYGVGEVETFDRLLELVHPADRGRMQHALDAHLNSESAFYQDEHRIQTSSGEWRWVLDRGMVLERDETGKALRATGITLDLSERKALEARLHQANKMEAVGRLAGGVAHDFNNLLTAINGYADLALMGLDDDDPIASHIRAIKRSGERAASLTSRLLAFGRRQILQPRLIDLNRVARSMKKLLEPVIGEDVNLVQRLDPEVRRVNADVSQMEQVIMNLAVNARDAMPTGGTLTIETRNVEVGPSRAAALPGLRPGSYVLLSVSDTGCGMDEHTRARVFEPFFTTKPQGQGTGLGLSMVYGIVKQSDGYTEIETAPGSGTAVRIYLPPLSADAIEAITPEIEEEAEQEPLEGTETVLLVEDDGAVRQLMRAVLKNRGYDVIDAGSAEEAITLFQEGQGRIDMLVSDVVLPGMNGDDLAYDLQSRVDSLAVLLISGYPRGAIGMQHRLPSGTHFLQKPFSPSKLCQTIRSILDSVE